MLPLTAAPGAKVVVMLQDVTACAEGETPWVGSASPFLPVAESPGQTHLSSSLTSLTFAWIIQPSFAKNCDR